MVCFWKVLCSTDIAVETDCLVTEVQTSPLNMCKAAKQREANGTFHTTLDQKSEKC
jgi:hypothetical protein